MKRKPLILALAALAIGLASCANRTPSGESSTAPEDAPSSEWKPSSEDASSSEWKPSSEDASSSEWKPSSENASSSASDWIDYASSGAVKLNLEYEGHSFWTDGVEKVTLYQTIDGDTAHFTTAEKNGKGDNLLKSRFYGIDTPESTGKVQPWGKPASKYTSKILENANKNGTIVVSSPSSEYGAPSADSTGSRYVSLIWVNESVKNAPISSLKLLNLMIVQDGYSWVKNVSDIPEYSDTFYEAETQAKEHKLNLFSDEQDPTYNYGGYQTVSLLDIKREVVACLNDPTHENAYDNAKVTVQGTVAGFSNHILYIQDFCSYVDDAGNPLYYNDDGSVAYQDKIDAGILGEYAGINIFVGMSSIPSKFTKVGNYIQVSALALNSDFGFQLTSGTFPSVSYSETDAQLLIKADKNTEEHKLYTFEYTSDGLNAALKSKDYSALNCSVKVTDPVKVTGGYDSDSATVLYTSSTDKTAWSVYFAFAYQPDPNDTALKWTSYEKFVDQSFLFSGVLGLHSSAKTGNDKFNIYPSKSSDIVWQKAGE